MFKTFGFQGGGGGSGGQFNPAQVFANGAPGLFYNTQLAPESIFFKDFALTPATALGDAIRIIVDALSLGREKRIFFNGATNTYVSIPDFAMSAATTLRLFGRIKAYALAPSALQMICGQWNATGNQRAYRLVLNTDGTLGFMISTDGTSQAGNIVASTAAVSTIVAAGVDILVDATLTFATKAVVFQYSLDDGATWDDLGDPGATTDDTIHNSTATFTGGASASGADLFTGSAAYVGVSFDAAATATIDAASYPGSGSSYTCTTGQTVTRNGSAFILGDGYHLVFAATGVRAELPYGGKRNLFMTATATMTTRNYTTMAVPYTLQMKGTGSITLTGTSTDGPLVGTGANDIVSLTFTPTAGTLTLTVAGTVTDCQLELGAVATAYQNVVQPYQVTEAGVPGVTWVYCDGTKYGSEIGSRNLTCMHDGTGGFAGMNVYVNKVDDGANDSFASSRVTGTDVGMTSRISDTTTNDARGRFLVTSSGGTVVDAQAVSLTIPRFDPFTLTTSLNAADSPDAVLAVSGSNIASANASLAFPTSAATYDMALFANPDGSEILPGYLGSGVFGAITNVVQQGQTNNWLAAQRG